MSSENKYICPKCKSENIQKCSILYETNSNSKIEVNTTLINKIKPPDSEIDESKLDLPKKPFDSGCFGCIFSFIMFILLFILFIFSSSENYSDYFYFIPIGFLICLFSWLFVLKINDSWKKECDKIKKEKQKEIDKEYNKKYKEWEQKFFCNRCGHIFIIKDE